MEHSDGETVAKRAKLSPTASADGGESASGTEVFLSALPDDLLIDILCKLPNTAVAAKTMALSGHWRLWRRRWPLLRELHFNSSVRLDGALKAHGAPEVLSRLVVTDQDASPDSLAAWLPIAAARLSGDLTFIKTSSGGCGWDGTFALPCFESATSIRLELDGGLLRLNLQPFGVFAKLSDLHLEHFELRSRFGLGYAVSSRWCPALRKLTVCHADGLGNFQIYSESLLQMELINLSDVQKIIVDAPALEKLTVSSCLCQSQNQPVVNISAPQLVELNWQDSFDPKFVELNKMAHLQLLDTSCFVVHGPDPTENHDLLMLLSRFEDIHNLNLSLLIHAGKMERNWRYLMGDMIRLPRAKFLSLVVMAYGHSFEASSFHVLRMCTGVTKLALKYGQPWRACSSGCICDERTNWETQKLALGSLKEAEISEMTGNEHEVAFARRLFVWATVLKKMTISFHCSVTQSKAKELCQTLLSFSRPQISMKFYNFERVLYVPED